MKRIKIVKLKELDDAVHPHNTYEGFERIGLFLAPPTIGERFYLLWKPHW